MYSRGSNPYGQLYGTQQSYGQNPGTSHSSLLSSAQDPEIGGFRPATSSQYGGQYGDVYGSSTLTSVQQVGSMSVKVSGSSSLQGRAGYASAMPESPKFGSGECASLSSLGYGKIGDPFSGEVPDYFSVERRNYSEHQNAYAGRDLQSEAARRYAESVGLSHQRQPELYDHLEQASLLRQQQMLKSQSLQTTSLEGGARQVDYLAARGAAILHATQDLASYGGRMDADPRNLSMLTGPSYGAQHQGSILGAAPLRNVDDLIYAQGSSSAGYGVSLPPGRDYAAAGKGLRGTSLDTDYPGSLLSCGGHSSVVGSRIDERKDDRGGYRRELEVRDEERRREHLHEREKEREREREKERERERERARERGRLLERRNKERERKRALETRRERTPPRVARDRQVSSTREERSSKRDSPRHESLHRRHSPVREKRREYICKVYPSCLVEVERDYLSISKRYPKLSISPEFSKVVLNWPKHNLNISLHTPVSFEHVLVEIESKAEHKEAPTERLAEESEQSRNQNTVWNAKVILMSGISSDALYDLSSDKIFDERIPHINNILRFAFLRKDRSFMAIGGRWDGVDGGDPSVDDSSLVHTALRHVKDLVQLDLCNCQHWNRFLEIHYDRVGKDGLFSHREITVLFIPDLSQCLPSLNDWRDQWLAHRKATSDRERHLASQKEKKPVEKDNVVKGDKTHSKPDKDGDSARTTKGKKDPHGSQSSQAVDGKKAGVDIQGDSAENQKGKDEGADVKGQSIVINKEQEPVAHVTEVQKPGKKKIVRKVVKQKAARKKAGGDSGVSKEKDKLDVADKESKTEIAVQQDGAKVDLNVGSAGKKKIVKKVVAKSALKQVQEDDSKDNVDNNSASATQGTVSKSIKKKKIIKKVPKKKITGVEDVGASADIKDDDKADSLVTNEKIIDTGKKTISNKDSKMIPAEKHGDDADMIKIKDEKGKKEGKGDDDKKEISSKTETDATKGKSSSKDGDGKLEKEKKGKYEKDEPRRKASKDVKEKGKSDEPPKHPGLILQTKQTKESKVRSTTLSLDSLLDYTDKDIEESTFELSLFAEAVYEMLQFQMGCRLLAFLEKLRLHFVNKRNQRKRQRDENPQKESEKEKSSRKRLKTTAELPMKSTSVKFETQNDAEPDNEETVAKDPKNEETVAKEETSVDGGDESSMDNEGDDYDPEEYEDEDQEMDDASHENDASKEAGPEDAKPKEENDQKDEKKEGVKRNKDENKTAEMGLTNMQKSKEKDADLGTEEKEKPATKERTIDKELLQAFRFFDRNRVGYIKVEDLRLIIHNLGKFLSHRDVKELVQSALLESNTARDNRILYNKLVRQ